MSYYYKVLKDSPIAFWTLNDSTSQAVDYSGFENHGLYTGVYPSNSKKIPLVLGSQYAARISSQSSIGFSLDGLGTKYTADHDFTLEFWFYPKIISNNTTTIFADTDNNIGVTFKNKNIIFSLDTETIEHTLINTNKSIYVVCKYLSGYAYIYIDGDLVTSRSVSQMPFTNTTLSLSCGPTQNSSDEFLINNIAVYRYGLSDKIIKDHYLENYLVNSVQVSYPDNGELFNIYDNGMRTAFSYGYPKDKEWEYFLTNDLLLNKLENYIQIAKTDSSQIKSVTIEDAISLPTGLSMDSSKINWDGSYGVSVYTSLDGTTYEECINGQAIPQYKYGAFNSQRYFYLKIIIDSQDSSKYLPALKSLEINFYSEQIMYSKNGGSYISKIDDKDVFFGKDVYPILSTNNLNGLLVPEDSGFTINTMYEVKSLEMFYTPSSLESSTLLSADSTAFGWNSSGVISKNNIESVYVNGEDMSSETNIGDILSHGHLNHIVIVLSDPKGGEITFNYNQSGCTQALYQHITLYSQTLTSLQATDHYNLYISKPRYQASSSSLGMTESGINVYNNDWLVIQNS